MPHLLHLWRRLVDAVAGANVKRQTLCDLDDRTLADIGVHRCEIASIEAEAQRSARQRTRLRIVSREAC
jgi:uncharacterized protein YjiS (DUF1127 family)